MIEGLKPYTAYKDSRVPWLGQVPKHWSISRSKRLFSARKDLAWPDDVQLSATQAYGVIPQAEYEKKVGRRVVKISMHLEKRRHVEKDDFVVSMRSFQGGLERAWASGAIRSSYVVLKPEPTVDVDFFAYLLKSHGYIRALQSTADFIRDGQDLNFSNFCQVDLPLPPMDEQVAIGRFLNHANRRIDRFIRAKQKLTAILNEQKQSITHRAVTQGLDPNVPLKESGVPWLGEIPVHWDTPLNQRIFREKIRPHYGKQETQLSLSQKDGLIATSNMKERSLQTSSFDNWKVTLPGDLVLNRFKAHLGVFFAASLRGIVSFHYGVFESRILMNAKYFELLYHTAPYRSIYAGRSNGMTVGLQNLSNQNFYAVRSLVPPFQEQDAIVLHVEAATADLKSAIARAEREISLIREYRTRLIADVVTGQLDVQEAVKGLPVEDAHIGEPVDAGYEIDEAELDDSEQNEAA